jgi:hypothetical protein
MVAFTLRIHGTSRGGTTGDAVVLDGALTLDGDICCVENLAARDAKNVPTLAPHPLSRSFA